MPNMNGTGPNGDGPMTGKGMGSCGHGSRRGVGGGRGFGRGTGRCCGGYGINAMPYQPTKEEYIKMLKEEIEDIQAEIDDLEKK